MLQGITGWSMIIIIYAVMVAVVAVVLYFVVRLAVLHAMKAHTTWLDQRTERS